MSWTKKERVLAVLSGEVPDRVPIFECLLNDDMLKHYYGSVIPVGDYGAMLKACSGCLDICHPLLVPNEPREEILADGTKKVYERWTCWDIPKRERDPDGDLNKMKREIEESEKYSPDPTDIERFKKKAAEANSLAGEMLYLNYGFSVEILPGSGGPGYENGVYLYADEPELTERWNRAKNRALLAWCEAYLDREVSPVIIIWNDIAFKNKLMYPPEVLAKLFLPSLNEVCNIAHSKGIKVIFHSDGFLTDYMGRLIDCGIDGFNPLEISAGMDFGLFKEKYGKRITIVGGLDAVDVLAFGTPLQVAEETKHLIKVAGRDGGLIAASASGQIDNSMPFENVMAYFETIWDYGIY